MFYKLNSFCNLFTFKRNFGSGRMRSYFHFFLIYDALSSFVGLMLRVYLMTFYSIAKFSAEGKYTSKHAKFVKIFLFVLYTITDI